MSASLVSTDSRPSRRIDSIRMTTPARIVEARREVPGLHPDRAPTILAGVVILIESMRLLGLESVETSEADILQGAALDAVPQRGDTG